VNIAATQITKFNPLVPSDVRPKVHICSFPPKLCNYATAEGTVYTAKILNREDLSRQLVKSATCTVTIPQFELTVPPLRGQLTTVEGLIRDIISDLGSDQPLRKYQNEAAYEKIEKIIHGFQEILGDEEDEPANGEEKTQPIETDGKEPIFSPFTVILDDPAGNSFIEFIGSMSDPKWNLRTYHRTHQQNVDLGIDGTDDSTIANKDSNATKLAKESLSDALAQATMGEVQDEEVLVFPGICSSCGSALDTLMKKVSIPYFKVW
jgi:zinc finger protein